MTPAETASTLRLFNSWRHGDDDDMRQPDPRKVGRAIDSAVEMLDEIDRLRAQNEVLIDAINAALHVMASAPAWNQMHREVIAGLQAVKKEMGL